MKTLCTLTFLLIGLLSPNANILIQGTVFDGSTNSPIAGATIMEKGTTNGVITDIDGKFNITLSSNNAIIQVSFIGYITEEITITPDTKKLNVNLTQDITCLEEVVVIGYGTSKISMCTGAVKRVFSGIKNKQNNNGYGYNNNNFYKYEQSNESYAHIEENTFNSTMNTPLSTFSIDVDRASYSNVRRFINNGQKPPSEAVRVEELINYFSYNYPSPQNEHPIDVFTEVTECPWNKEHMLLKLGMQAIKLDEKELPPSNLVFLIDVSGSMSSQNKLPLVKQSLYMLTEKLRSKDRVAIVVYAGAAGLVLPSTSGAQKEKIRKAINNLTAGGSTAGGAGIELAYKTATRHYQKGGNNRIIIATDGDFNVGLSSNSEMKKLIKEKRDEGIYLTCLGYGMGNYKDSKLEILADNGNGNYAYIDNIQEAEKTLIAEFGGTLFTVAKDVKIQIEFNPFNISAYRLIGYENRLLNDEDFNDDTKDAGEVGSGHTVTALYELIPAGTKNKYTKNIDPLKYQTSNILETEELATVKIRYKPTKDNTSIFFDKAVIKNTESFNEASEDLRFSASVAMFGMLISESEYGKGIDYKQIIELAQNARSEDKDGYRAEFVRLVKSLKNFR
jgi:Ca-activated chloride channel family protein